MDDPPEYTQNVESNQPRWKKWFTFSWIRTPIGLLKIGEFVVLLLALIIMSTVDMVGRISSIEFFIFVNTSAWIVVLVVLILYILNLYHRLPNIISSNLVMLVCCGVGFVSELICSSVVIGKFNFSSTITAAGAFGLIAMLFFLFEAIYYLIKCRYNGFFGTVTTEAVDTTEAPPTDF